MGSDLFELSGFNSFNLIMVDYLSALLHAFATAYGFTHITSNPKYQQANGEADRAVKTIKEVLKKKSDDPYTTLLAYRSTPMWNGYSPAELLMGRKLLTAIPMIPSSLKPKWPYFQNMKKKQREIRKQQKQAFDKCHRVVDL